MKDNTDNQNYRIIDAGFTHTCCTAQVSVTYKNNKVILNKGKLVVSGSLVGIECPGHGSASTVLRYGH